MRAAGRGQCDCGGGFGSQLGADLTIVGPELPLVNGIADEFARRGLAILGPGKAAARLEGSKIFAKQFMERHGIPTAGVRGVFETAADAYAGLDSGAWPLVIKADGLCAGKGVLVASDAREGAAFIERLIVKREFGDAGARVLAEEGLAGRELSYIVLTDGENFISLAPTRDHKRAFDNDEGPNTGGMGTYSSDEMLTRGARARNFGDDCAADARGIAKRKYGVPGIYIFWLDAYAEWTEGS